MLCNESAYMKLKELDLQKLSKKITKDGLKPYLESISSALPAQIQAVESMAETVRGSAMEGLPFVIALLKSKLLTDHEIASELQITLRAVRKYSQVPGFNDTVTRLMPAVWSDMQLTAWAVLNYHMIENHNPDIAKWILEHTGGVMTHSPMTTHQHVHLNQSTPQLSNKPGQLPQLPGQVDMTADALAMALTRRMEQSHLNEDLSVPVIRVSVDEDADEVDIKTIDK